MTREEAIAHGKEQLEVFGGEHAEFIKLAIKALDKQDRILQILDDCELEAWEILEMIKEVVRE